MMHNVVQIKTTDVPDFSLILATWPKATHK